MTYDPVTIALVSAMVIALASLVHRRRPDAARLSITLTAKDPAMYSFSVGQTAVATPGGLHANGKPGATLPAEVRWETTDAAIVAIHANPDGSAVLGAVAPGVAKVSVGSGTLTSTLEITVNPGPAKSIEITVGVAVDTPEIPGNP